ncbi:MAG: hypothetical protein HXS44_16445 [Theionarchaea archaeon]|nr:hypothetical protein [Theionarchaea archaeon]
MGRIMRKPPSERGKPPSDRKLVKENWLKNKPLLAWANFLSTSGKNKKKKYIKDLTYKTHLKRLYSCPGK